MCDADAMRAAVDDAVRPLHDRLGSIETLIKEQRRKLPAIVDIFVQVISDTQCVARPQSWTLAKINTVFAYSSVGTATLTIGDMVIPIAGNSFNLSDWGFLLHGRDTIKLTAGSAGGLIVRLCGEEIPTDGMW